MIDTIVFDIGNVLIKWDPRVPYRDYFKDPKDMDFFFENICTMEWNEEQDKGRRTSEATQILIDQYPDWEEPIRMYYGRWKEMILGSIDGTVEILKALKNNGDYRLLALTNWSDELFPWALETFDFLGIFEGILVSGEEKMKKPDIRIYKRFQEKFQAEAAQCIFIDDSLKNVEGAKEAGWEAILFEGPEQLIDSLKVHGITI